MRQYLIISLTALGMLLALPAAAQQVTRDITFPVEGPVTFRDDFGEPRAGHTHIGNDIIGGIGKGQHLLAAVDGVVEYVVFPEAVWGYEIIIRDSEGYTYHYIHINNDTPGTDDDKGGYDNAYAPGIAEGVHVTKGQFVAYMGDSGDAENVSPHLHFEIHLPNGDPVDPYPSLIKAFGPGTFDAAASTMSNPDINTDKELVPYGPGAPCVSGSRVKIKSSTAVYYCGADGKRYVFPSDKIYFSWYPNFTGVTTVTDAAMAAIPLGGNVTYRPGVRMVKVQTDPKTYVVDHGGILRWVESPEIAVAIYGTAWAKKVDDLSDAFFVNYKIGDSVTSSAKH